MSKQLLALIVMSVMCMNVFFQSRETLVKKKKKKDVDHDEERTRKKQKVDEETLKLNTATSVEILHLRVIL